MGELSWEGGLSGIAGPEKRFPDQSKHFFQENWFIFNFNKIDENEIDIKNTVREYALAKITICSGFKLRKDAIYPTGYVIETPGWRKSKTCPNEITPKIFAK